MKHKYLFLLFLFINLSICRTEGKSSKPIKVIITAGQSNTDGRVFNEDLPDYIRQLENKQYKYCKWNSGNSNQTITGRFSPFWPKMFNENNPNRWAYDAITYYWLDQALQEDFYVIKWSRGGTSIDTSVMSRGGYYWSADENWLSQTKSTINGGKSLLLSFEENISKCIDVTLSKLNREYEIVAFLWHQGESDSQVGDKYYENIKNVLNHVRTFLVNKTGKETYMQLPFIYGTISHFNKRYNKEVEDAMYRLAKDDINCHVIDMSKGELQDDKLHFTHISSEYLGLQMYNKLVEIGAIGPDIQKIDNVIYSEDKKLLSIAKFKGDKQCAISYTFDDGLKEHYTIVAPWFKEYGYQGTFWINGAKINKSDVAPIDTTRVSWNNLKEMAVDGHEISNHGWSHKKLTTIGVEEIKKEIEKNDSIIYANIGIWPRTFCYANNAHNELVRSLASKNRVGTRTKQRAIGSKSTSEDLNKWVQTLMEKRDWGVGMTHGMTYGYDAFLDLSIFKDHLDSVKALEDSIWVGTFHDVASYVKEREHIMLKIEDLSKNRLKVRPLLSLDKKLFTQELTMILNKEKLKKVRVKQDGKFCIQR